MYPKFMGVLLAANLELAFRTNGQLFEETFPGNYKILCITDLARVDFNDFAESCIKRYELTPAQQEVAFRLAEENFAEWLKKEGKVNYAQRAEFDAWAATKPEGFGSELSFPRPVSEDQVHLALAELKDEDETGTLPATE